MKKHLVSYQTITCNLVLNIKLDGKFTHKTLFVADGSKTKVPKSLTYFSVVSQDSVRVTFLTASFNNLDLSTCLHIWSVPQ